MAAPPAASPPVVARLLPRLGGLLAGLAALALITLVVSRESHPRMPAALTLEIAFPPGVAGATEPLVCTGMFREGDVSGGVSVVVHSSHSLCRSMLDEKLCNLKVGVEGGDL